jgi:hypothetical protein
MIKSSFTVIGSSVENMSIFSNIDKAIAFCRTRLYDNFNIYIQADTEASKLIARTRLKWYANLSNITIQ